MRKKWFFGILILVVVGIVLTIVFVNLFKDKDTKALAQKVNEVSETGYLSEDSDEYLKISEYLEKMPAYFSGGTEKIEIENYKKAYQSFVIVVDFFNKEIMFSTYTDEYNNNLKAITNAFNVAQDNANKLKNYINETSLVTGDSKYWNKNTWQTSKEYMKNIFDNTREALSKLGNVYSASVNSIFVNNAFTDIIFEGFNALTNDVAGKIAENTSVGEKLLNFSNSYFGETNEKVIIKYVYNKTLQTSVQDIAEKGIDSNYYNGFLAGNIFGRA